jgi:photosystem II stability/assembly factor-like uncharacterized protein
MRLLLSATVRFERIGPYGGTVRSLLISSKNSRIVYLGTSDGQMFQSQDGGLSWNPVYPGIPRRQIVLDTLVEDPADPDHLFAGGWDLRSNGGGLFESNDASTTWSEVTLAKPSPAVRGLAISSRHPAYMIAGTLAGVFVSSDGGHRWQPVGTHLEGFLQVESVAIDPDDPRVLYVGTWHLGYRSTDFGVTWVRNDRGMVADSDVFSLAIDGKNPRTVFASACTGFYRSRDSGSTWTRLKVLPGSYLVRAQLVVIDPTNARRVYGGTTEGLFVSQDAGLSWKRITAANLIIHAVQIDPHNGNVIMVGTENSGVLRSENGGRSWTSANRGFVSRSITLIQTDPSVPDRLYVGDFSEGNTGGFHIWNRRTSDWVPLPGREIPGEGLLSVLSIPANRGILAGTARGLFQRRDGSGTWSRLPGPIGSLSVYDLVQDRDGKWIFAGTNDGVYRTPAGNLNFQKPNGYRFLPRVFSLLASQRDSAVLIAGTHLGVLRSEDHGETWQLSSAGIPDRTTVETVVSSPSDADHLFAGTTNGLFVSRDGGHRWQRMQDGGLGVDVSSVIFLDASGLRILASDTTFGGVFLSEDAGETWSRIEDAEFGSPVRIMAQDPVESSVVYLGTATEGVYRLQMPTAASRFPVHRH